MVSHCFRQDTCFIPLQSDMPDDDRDHTEPVHSLSCRPLCSCPPHIRARPELLWAYPFHPLALRISRANCKTQIAGAFECESVLDEETILNPERCRNCNHERNRQSQGVRASDDE